VPDATFACPDLTTFARLEELGLEVVGQRLEPDRAEVVAMDGFTGFKTATTEELPDAVAVMDPFQSCARPATPWTSAADEFSKTLVGTAATWATRSTPRGGPCTPAPTCSPTSRHSDCKPCSRPTSTSRPRRPGASNQRMIAAHREPDRARGRQLMQLLRSSRFLSGASAWHQCGGSCGVPQYGPPTCMAGALLCEAWRACPDTPRRGEAELSEPPIYLPPDRLMGR